jgi:rhamnosyltransferase subunit B
VLPRAAVLVHHGGIGTAAQALAAGIPQLVVPSAHDQPDNAVRIRRLGVGDFLLPRAYRTAAVIERVAALTRSGVRENCRRYAGAMAGGRSLETAAALIEQLATAQPAVEGMCRGG